MKYIKLSKQERRVIRRLRKELKEQEKGRNLSKRDMIRMALFNLEQTILDPDHVLINLELVRGVTSEKEYNHFTGALAELQGACADYLNKRDAENDPEIIRGDLH